MTTADYLLRVAREGLLLALLVSAPVVLAALAVGLVTSILQATTQVQEHTLHFVPKLLAVFAALAIASPWIAAQLVRFFHVLLEAIPRIT